MIRARIKAETGLTASAGISYCKFLAKIASDINKPDGQAVITPRAGRGFRGRAAGGKFHGVGPATAARMERLGIRTGADLRARICLPAGPFRQGGALVPRHRRGIDNRPVQPHRPRKSLGTEDTFAADIFDAADAARAEVRRLAAKVWRQAAARGLRGRSVTLKVKYADFRQITRSRTLAAPFAAEAELASTSPWACWRRSFPPRAASGCSA
jgi:DNA polymerase IV